MHDAELQPSDQHMQAESFQVRLEMSVPERFDINSHVWTTILDICTTSRLQRAFSTNISRQGPKSISDRHTTNDDLMRHACCQNLPYRFKGAEVLNTDAACRHGSFIATYRSSCAGCPS